MLAASIAGVASRGEGKLTHQVSKVPCSFGYSMCSWLILAKEVIRCSFRPSAVIWTTEIFLRPTTASEINCRWHWLGSASAHMMAEGASEAISTRASKAR